MLRLVLVGGVDIVKYRFVFRLEMDVVMHKILVEHLLL